tara:strand:+ start:588 stop:1112 length:525 start_codon:yes stop_codon:yes gene_type:complete
MSNVEKVLDTFGKKVVQTARGILNAKGKNASGDLGSSLGYYLNVYESGAVDMSFVAEGYAQFVDKGVKGSKSNAKAPKSPYAFKTSSKIANIGAIDKWVVRKGIKGVRDDKGKFIPRKSIVFLIAKNIKLYGIEPSNFFTDAFNVAYRELPKDFIKAYAKDTQQFLKFVSKDIE